MKIHHLNCATMCPAGRSLINGEGSLFESGEMICHCLLVETEQGLVLIDTGFGRLDIEQPAHLGRMFHTLTRPRLDLKETARAQVEAMGFSADDVRHIVVTHLDLDHAGGLPDFPKAVVHVHGKERAAAEQRVSVRERERYKPLHWAHGPRWSTYDEFGERWFGFDAVRALAGVPAEVLLVPLLGHSRGHSGVAVKGDTGWLLHAGDAYFFHGEVHSDPPHCPGGLRLFQRAVAIDDRARRHNQDRLRELSRAHGSEVRIFSAHDPKELAAARAGR